jgi:hypothetical protein
MNFAFCKKNILISFCLALLLVTIVVLTPPCGGDNDIWWHLTYGEHFVNNLTPYIDHSAFSWTPASPDWKYVTWIGSSLLYLAYQAGGFPGVFILHSLVFILTLCTYLLYIKLINKKLDVPDIFCMLLVAVTSNSIYIKPDTFTTLFFALSVFIYFYSKTTSKSIFFLNIPLYLIWVNTHGGFIIGLFFMSLALAMELINFYLIKSAVLPKNLIRDFALSVFLSYVVLLINPYGPEYLISLSKDLFFSDYMDHSEYLLAYLSFWKQLSPDSGFISFTIEGWRLILAMTIFLLACAYAYSKNKKIDITIVSVNIIFFFISMMTGRTAKFFPIIWLFSIAFILYPFEAHLPRKKLTVVSFVLFILFTLTYIENCMLLNNRNSWFGSGFANSWVPVKEAAFIKKHKLPGPIFNDYLSGGYMIWSMYPEYKVFIDPRYGPYTTEVRADWFDFMYSPTIANRDRIVSKYGFNTVFLELGLDLMIKRFIDSPDWKLVYFDINAAVFIRTNIAKSDKETFDSVDLGSERFRDISDPSALLNIFNMYNRMASPREMTTIRNIYSNNVSDYYFLKKRTLATMDFVITTRYPMPKQSF